MNSSRFSIPAGSAFRFAAVASVLAALFGALLHPGTVRGQARLDQNATYANVFSAVPRTTTISTTLTISGASTPTVTATGAIYRATVNISGTAGGVGQVSLATAGRSTDDVIELDCNWLAGTANPGLQIYNASTGGTKLLDLPAPGFPAGTSRIYFFRYTGTAWARVTWPPDLSLYTASDLIPANIATAGQFQNGTPFGGWLARSVLSGQPVATGTTSLVYPQTPDYSPTATGSARLESARIGRPVVLIQANYAFGDPLPAPTADATGAARIYLAEPAHFLITTTTTYTTTADGLTTVSAVTAQAATNALPGSTTTTTTDAVSGTQKIINTNTTYGNFAAGFPSDYSKAQPDPYYWSPNAQKVYATQAGVITVTWRDASDPTNATKNRVVTYVISTSPKKPARKIFWTENGFNGPHVTVNPARVNLVKVVYNPLVPELVKAQESYRQPSQSPLTQVETKTIWYDAQQHLISAYNKEGRVFIEYLGNLTQGGKAREQLGTEIVELVKEVAPTAQSVDLGERILPPLSEPNPADLNPVVVAGLANAEGAFVEQDTGADGRPLLFAIRQTAPQSQAGLLSNESLVYWEEADSLGVYWPKHYCGYAQDWPPIPDQLSKYSIYARPDSTSPQGKLDSVATGVRLDSANRPRLIYQDDPNKTQAVLTTENVFYTDLTAAFPNNKALVRYSQGSDIWFERIFSKLDVNFSGFGAATYDKTVSSAAFTGNVAILDASMQTAAGKYNVTVSDPATGQTYDYFLGKDGAGKDILTAYQGWRLDSGFAPVLSPPFVYAAVVQSDGKILISGNFTQVNGISRNGVARLNSDGTLDATFGDAGVSGGVVTLFAVQSDGKVLISGSFTSVAGSARNGIARLNSNGTMDPTFFSGAAATYGGLEPAIVKKMVLQSDGKILIGGQFYLLNGVGRESFGRLNSDGTLDTAFNPPKAYYISSIAVQPDGKVLIGGYMDGVLVDPVQGIYTDNGIARLNASDGSRDTTFAGFPDYVDIGSIALQPDGKVLVGARYVPGAFFRLNSNGTPDTTFRTVLAQNVNVGTIALLTNGKALINGDFTSVNGVARNGIALLNGDGTLDTSFGNPNPLFAGALYASENIRSVAVQSDGKILFGGGFTSVDGQTRNGLARYTPYQPGLPSTVTLTFHEVPTYADVGARITPLLTGPDTYASGDNSVYVGYIRQAKGNYFNSTAYQDPFVVGFEQAAQGAIIPVNAHTDATGKPTDSLEVWWYKKSAPPAGSRITGTYWPSFVQVYSLRWPVSPPQIVLASNLGSGPLPSLQASGSIYTQNDSTLAGYNPNEEHALTFNGVAYALRDDLNTRDANGQWRSSKPSVLLSYTEADGRPAMNVFDVLRENATYKFIYPATAGTPLGAPAPLGFLPPPVLPDGKTLASYEIQPTLVDPPLGTFNPATADANFVHYQKFTWTDRKGAVWIYRGPHTGPAGAPVVGKSFSMRYFYQTQPGFFYPSLAEAKKAQPLLGTITPYLRSGTPGAYVGDEVSGVVETAPASQRKEQPLDIVFNPLWPASAPELNISETLTTSKRGLPAVRGQSSTEIIYQQSIALDNTQTTMAARKKSARLYDPTVKKTYALDRPTGTSKLTKIPDSVKTSLYLGLTYFPNLPPHLSQRIYFDPNEGPYGSLVFKGLFVPAETGETYLQLNVMSAGDLAAVQGLVPVGTDDASTKIKTDWNNAIAGLAVTLPTYVEDPKKRGTFTVDDVESKYPRYYTLNGVKTLIPNGLLPKITPAQFAVGDLAELFYSDTARDSYAVAAIGGGAGYVVLATNNGQNTDITGEGLPVSLQVFKVNTPLYRGELKGIQSLNPLDEKYTLQHSGDFAGRPEDYDFEWRYTGAANGKPTVYTYAYSTVLDNGAWSLINNPDSTYAKYRDPAATVSAPVATSANLPGPVVINDGNGTPANGVSLPDAILRRTFATPARPLRLFLSLDLDRYDGAIVYLNDTEVAVWNVPGRTNTATGTPPATTPAFTPLSNVFEVPAEALRNTTNAVTVQLYTSADAGATSVLNVRLEGAPETDQTSSLLAVPVVAGVDVAGMTAGSAQGKNRLVIQGASIFTLTDNYFTMRYRARNPDNAAYVANAGWSKWTEPALVPGWIKRVLDGINPFQQRITDLYSNAVNTNVSLVQQAGKRWEGDIPLNLDAVDKAGLIEIYETVLRRGKTLSIEGSPVINDAGANQALLLAAGYLNDLYMILGNEAFADAANSTIAFNTADGSSFGDVATALFSFKGVVPSVLEEELALLRGRDNFLTPGTQRAPVYNRLYWNYTRGIDAGEAVYALNYNIKDIVWDYSRSATNPGNLLTDGIITAADAAALYPQGHGDAYGHYLTALTGYYGLLANSNFSWSPQSEQVNVLGAAVEVDYLDERKFAGAAAALARSASEIMALTYRQAFSAADNAGWSKFKDTTAPKGGIQRAWGVDDWAARGGQGAYFHWATGNSLLPAVDADSTHSGIQKVDRTTVAELAEIADQATAIQQTLDNADARLNPLGLATGALAFDISPAEIDDGKTHYEQIYSRAVTALGNALSAFNNAKSSTQFLRQQEDSLADQVNAVSEQEQAYTNQLIEIYGTPYPDDIGASSPGHTYGRTTPDQTSIIRSMWTCRKSSTAARCPPPRVTRSTRGWSLRSLLTQLSPHRKLPWNILRPSSLW